jgi:hypothetical protein
MGTSWVGARSLSAGRKKTQQHRCLSRLVMRKARPRRRRGCPRVPACLYATTPMPMGARNRGFAWAPELRADIIASHSGPIRFEIRTKFPRITQVWISINFAASAFLKTLCTRHFQTNRLALRRRWSIARRGPRADSAVAAGESFCLRGVAGGGGSSDAHQRRFLSQAAEDVGPTSLGARGGTARDRARS